MNVAALPRLLRFVLIGMLTPSGCLFPSDRRWPFPLPFCTPLIEKKIYDPSACLRFWMKEVPIRRDLLLAILPLPFSIRNNNFAFLFSAIHILLRVPLLVLRSISFLLCHIPSPFKTAWKLALGSSFFHQIPFLSSSGSTFFGSSRSSAGTGATTPHPLSFFLFPFPFPKTDDEPARSPGALSARQRSLMWVH